jgi:hypothetical protein
MRPDLSLVPEHFHRYINEVNGDDFRAVMRDQSKTFVAFLTKLPADKIDHAYAPGKWTVKEMLQHIIDAERVFGYRALCIARQEKQSLPGFDENEYADTAKTSGREWQELITEFDYMRRSHEIMFGSFDDEQLNTTGTANNKPISALAIGYVLVGHINHHLKILRERYLA